MHPQPIELVAAGLFCAAVLHTFIAKPVAALADRFPRHAGVFHLLGEVEIVFGLWAIVLVAAMALLQGAPAALAYADSRDYGEPLFVFVVMVVAGSRPVLVAVQLAVHALARLVPLPVSLGQVWLGLAVVPLMGSLVTEPAAMTIAALTLAPLVFRPDVAEWAKYLALGVLFVNVSIGGTLTSYAAPPVLMVAAAWQWDTAHMLATFGWKAAVAVAVNASLATFALRRYLIAEAGAAARSRPVPLPWAVVTIHLMFLAGVVVLAHHTAALLGVFLLFLGFTRAYGRHQSPLILREALLVAFFLAGLVALGGLQRWWLQPLLSELDPLAMFAGALALTAVTDNAALTYLGSLVPAMNEQAKYMLMAGAVAGGGLTVIANAPNPAGVALLRHGFLGASVGAAGLLAGASVPTAIAAAALLLA